MKLRTKRIAALGMSTMMMSSMAMGVYAADGDQVRVNNNATGSTEVTGNADIAVDGWIKDTNPSSSKESYSSSQNQPQSSGESGGTNASTTSWGDDSTKDTTQLIITAPTKLTFMAAGKGNDAKLIDKTVEGDVVKGEILNQLCYVQKDLSVVPKKVDVTANTKLGNEQNFSLKEDAGKNWVEGVKLYVGDTGVLFNDTVGKDTAVGTLPAGTVAQTTNNKEAVNGSKTAVFFNGSAKDDASVRTGFSDTYETNSAVHSNYTLNLKYTVK